MSKQWYCGACKHDIDTSIDGCLADEDRQSNACPLWWQPVTCFEKFMCFVGQCQCPVGPSYCKKCGLEKR